MTSEGNEIREFFHDEISEIDRETLLQITENGNISLFFKTWREKFLQKLIFFWKKFVFEPTFSELICVLEQFDNSTWY